MRRHKCANKEDAKKTYRIVDRCMSFINFVSNLLRKKVLGGLGDTSQPGLKNVKVTPKSMGTVSLFQCLFEHICWKVRSGKKEVFFGSLPRAFFLDFWHFWDALAGHFGEVFVQVLIAVGKTQHLKNHEFIQGLALFWPPQLAPEASRGRKTRMRKHCQF